MRVTAVIVVLAALTAWTQAAGAADGGPVAADSDAWPCAKPDVARQIQKADLVFVAVALGPVPGSDAPYVEGGIPLAIVRRFKGEAHGIVVMYADPAVIGHFGGKELYFAHVVNDRLAVDSCDVLAWPLPARLRARLGAGVSTRAEVAKVLARLPVYAARRGRGPPLAQPTWWPRGRPPRITPAPPHRGHRGLTDITIIRCAPPPVGVHLAKSDEVFEGVVLGPVWPTGDGPSPRVVRVAVIRRFKGRAHGVVGVVTRGDFIGGVGGTELIFARRARLHLAVTGCDAQSCPVDRATRRKLGRGVSTRAEVRRIVARLRAFLDGKAPRPPLPPITWPPSGRP